MSKVLRAGNPPGGGRGNEIFKQNPTFPAWEELKCTREKGESPGCLFKISLVVGPSGPNTSAYQHLWRRSVTPQQQMRTTSSSIGSLYVWKDCLKCHRIIVSLISLLNQNQQQSAAVIQEETNPLLIKPAGTSVRLLLWNDWPVCVRGHAEQGKAAQDHTSLINVSDGLWPWAAARRLSVSRPSSQAAQ